MVSHEVFAKRFTLIWIPTIRYCGPCPGSYWASHPNLRPWSQSRNFNHQLQYFSSLFEVCASERGMGLVVRIPVDIGEWVNSLDSSKVDSRGNQLLPSTFVTFACRHIDNMIYCSRWPKMESSGRMWCCITRNWQWTSVLVLASISIAL